MIPIPLATQSYQSSSLPLSAQELINMYPEPATSGSKAPFALFGTPGTESVATLGSGPVKGSIVMNGLLYVVSGDSLYSVDSEYTVTQIPCINNFIKNGTFDADSSWTKGTNTTISGGQACLINDGATEGFISQQFVFSANTDYTVSLDIKSAASWESGNIVSLYYGGDSGTGTLIGSASSIGVTQFALTTGSVGDGQLHIESVYSVDFAITVPNGDFETGDLTNWNINTGFPAALTDTGSGAITPYEGSYFLASTLGDVAATTISDKITLTDAGLTSEAIASGTVTLTLSWYQKRFTDDNNDPGRAGLRFFDSGDSQIGSTDYSSSTDPASWTNRTHAVVVPTNAVTVDIVLYSSSNIGQYASAFFDKVELQATATYRQVCIDDVVVNGQCVDGPLSSYRDMAHNGTQLMIACDGYGLIYTTTGGLVDITDDDYPGADQVDFIDGFFVTTRDGSGRFYKSAAYDGTDWTATDYATAEGSPDNIVGQIVDHREVWLFGEKTTEVWWNEGVNAFPFSRLQNAFIEQGCAARFSIAKLANTVFWLGDDRVVYMAQGYAPTPVSTYAISQSIQGYETVSDAFAYTYTDRGHKFYVLTFPTESETWCYDLVTQKWHKRQYNERNKISKERFIRHRGNSYSYFNGDHLVGDFEDGSLWKLSNDSYTDGSAVIRRLWTSGVVQNQEERSFMSELQLVFEQGTGLITGQGSDPQVMLQYSDDGGKTWSNEKWRSIGQIGKYKHRSIWRRLGNFRSRIFRWVIADPVKVVVLSAHGE